MDIKFGNQIIKSYKRLSYTAWYALAEFVDNSTESYIANKDLLDEAFNGNNLTVSIRYDVAAGTLEVEDNSIGMSEDDLRDALTVGKLPDHPSGRSRYGLGMKTAACWLGDVWTVTTKKLGEVKEHTITVDVNQVADENTDLHHSERDVEDANLHYTILQISSLNRTFTGKTIAKIKDYLRSMYRRDFENYGLKLFWNNVPLTWDYDEMIYSKLHNGKAGIKKFEFTIGQNGDAKLVKGWVGVLEKGSRRDAGFSIIQSDRVIKGWPDSYRPEPIYGDNRNDLVNQRLVGELVLDNFVVSHTKDEILFLNNEQDELEAELMNECSTFRTFASEYRKYMDDERFPTANQRQRAVDELLEEMKSEIFKGKIARAEIASVSLLQDVKHRLIAAVKDRVQASIDVRISDVGVLVYLDSNLASTDPYVLIDATQNRASVTVVINGAHPHWSYLSGGSDVLNFIRHCTYDGVAEWKAHFAAGRLDPDTIKSIKDDLLRVPFEIENAER